MIRRHEVYPPQLGYYSTKSSGVFCVAVMKSEGFKHLKQSCPSLMSELLNTVAAADKSSTSGQSNKKRSVSSVLGCDTSNANVRQVRRRA